MMIACKQVFETSILCRINGTDHINQMDARELDEFEATLLEAFRQIKHRKVSLTASSSLALLSHPIFSFFLIKGSWYNPAFSDVFSDSRTYASPWRDGVCVIALSLRFMPFICIFFLGYGQILSIYLIELIMYAMQM